MSAQGPAVAAAVVGSAARVFAVIVAFVAGVAAPLAASSLRQPSVYPAANALYPAAAAASDDLVADLRIVCFVVSDMSYRFSRCPCLESSDAPQPAVRADEPLIERRSSPCAHLLLRL